MKHATWVAPVIAVALALTAGNEAPAAMPDWQDALTGRLQRIKETRTVRVGYRENAIPFSYLGSEAKPVGYTLDLCRAIVAAIGDDLGVENLAVDYVKVTAQDRLERVVSGAVDLECGSTTNTAERRQRVAFSPTIFVTGTRIAVARASPIRGVDGLAGRNVAVVRGTSNEQAMREIDRLSRLGITFVAADDYRDALTLLVSGKADALAADDVLVRGLLAETRTAREVRLVGDMLSFEAYGIVYPRDDPALADAVARTLSALAASREIIWIYNRWFLRPLPSGSQLDLPMSTQLKRSLELVGLPPD